MAALEVLVDGLDGGLAVQGHRALLAFELVPDAEEELLDLGLAHGEVAPEAGGGLRVVLAGGLRGLLGLVGAVLVELLLDLRVVGGLVVPAVLLRLDWVALVLGEEVVEVQLLFLHRYNYRISDSSLGLPEHLVLQPGLAQLGVLLLRLALVVLVGLLPELPVLGVVEVGLLELLALLLHRPLLLRRDADVQLALDLQQKRVARVDVLPPQFLQFFHLQELLVVLLCELVDRGAELALHGDQPLLVVLGDDQPAGLLGPVVAVELPYLFLGAAAQHVGHAVLRVVDLPQHHLAVVLADLRVHPPRGGQQDVPVEGPVLLQGAIGLVGQPNEQLPAQDLRVDRPLDLVDAFELLGPC